jgi:tetratricopeptide (TPR) repeat protein
MVDQKRYEEAIDRLKPLVDDNPAAQELHQHLASSYYALGRHEEARRHIEAYLKLNPGDRAFVDNLGAVLLQLGKPREAVGVLQHGLRLPCNLVETNLPSGVSPVTVSMRLNLAAACKRLDKLQDALDQYRLAIQADPDNLTANSNLGNLYTRSGNPAEAIACYRRALRVTPDDAGLHSNLGAALALSGNLAEAIREYRQSIALDPKQPDVHINLGDALVADGQTDEALAPYREAAGLAPKERRPVLVLARTLAAQNRNDAAAKILLDFLAAAESADVYDNLGLVYARAGRTPEAIAAYRNAMRLDPASEPICNNLGLLLAKKGRHEEALRIWRGGLELHPDSQLLAYDLAWHLATGPDAKLRNGVEAVRWAERLNEATGRSDARVLDALAAAYARADRFDDAARTARLALERANALGKPTLAAEVEKRLALYLQSQAYVQEHEQEPLKKETAL